MFLLSAVVQLGSVLNEEPQCAPLTASLLVPQPAAHITPHTTTHSAVPVQQPSSSPASSRPASPFPSPQSPPPRAGSPEAPLHKIALLPTCSPPTLPSPSLPLEEEPTYQSNALTGEMGLEDKQVLCHVTSANNDGQLQSRIQLAKDKHQSHAEPLEGEEELIPTDVVEREGGQLEDQSDVEPVSPVLELDLDNDVMAPFSRRGMDRNLRPPPCSSRPSDDLSIRLRQSPFSTEASPETSPSRLPVTPPPSSPPSIPLWYPPPARESSPLSKVNVMRDNWCSTLIFSCSD